MHVIAHSTEQQQPSASWYVVIFAVLASAFTAAISLFVLFSVAAAFNVFDVFPDARNGVFAFLAFVAVLSAPAILASYSMFPLFSNLINVSFTRLVRWVIFPILIVIPIFIYALVGVSYVHP